MNGERGALNEVDELGASPAHLTPWRDYTEMRCQMDELFNRALGYTPLARMFAGDTQLLDPDLDIYELDGKVVVIVALPGFTPDQIDVEATSNTATVQGERKPFFVNEEAVAYRLGWSTGVNRVHTHFSMPRSVDPCQAEGIIADGVLRLELPRTDQLVSKFVKVPIRGV